MKERNQNQELRKTQRKWIEMDREYRLPRAWSNLELKKYAHLFNGAVANISGYKDRDKQGSHYKDYFYNAKSYWITNAPGDKGFQNNIKNELPLVLGHGVTMINYFDTIFCHTVFEHIYNVTEAFKDFCSLTKDIAIIVVPFKQEHHTTSSYGDYWRFTKDSVFCLFTENAMEVMYLSQNNDKNAGIYIFAIASKNSNMWADKI